MKLKSTIAVGAVALAAVAALAGCSSNSSSGGSTSSSSPSASAVDLSSLSGTITAGGSSAQANVQQAWTAAFTAQATGVKVNYDKSQGSGGGVTNWLSGSYDFAGTDAAMNAQQYSAANGCAAGSKGLDIPVYLSGVDIIYKLQGVSSLKLDANTIAGIFSGKITKWNDPAIAKLNSGTTLPATAISVVHRSDASGTTNNFTTYLHQMAPSVWTSAANTAWPNSVGSGQQGGSGVVNTVEAGSGTIGYADQSSIGKAAAAQVEIGATGQFVSYSAARATESFAESGVLSPQGTNDLTFDIDTTKITNASAYPIPLLSYDVLCQNFKDSTQAKLTEAYVGFIGSKTGQQVGAQNAGAAPLPTTVQTKIAASLATVK
ncbi:phosphate ABC transporter substrate-binding protein PstS [Gryllotalpicola reticulitermitis]|uniref:Phosphate-binding protein n=1 Tax=Gryllotalpicola reticulitermitis TaxID=1184153 RepID=A0ABV8Q4H7_9MICO